MGREDNILSFEHVYLRCLGDIQTIEHMGLQLRRKDWAGGVVWEFVNKIHLVTSMEKIDQKESMELELSSLRVKPRKD